MKLLLLLLGYYSKHTPFYLYQIPDTTILLFKLSDISALFNVSDLARHPSLNQVPHGECYSINTSGGQHDDDDGSDGQQDYFLSAQVLSRTAVALNRYRLAELCKLKPNDYAAGLANSILKNVATFEHAKDEGFHLMDLPLSPVVSPVPSPKRPGSLDSNSKTTSAATSSTTTTTASIENTTSNSTHQQGATLSPRVHPVKSEPLSPPPLRLSQPKETKDDQRSPNPMALGKVLWSKGTERRSPSTRPSTDDDLSSNKKRQRTERKVLPKPTHTVSSQQSHPSMMNTFTSGQGQTLLAKRQGKNSRHLTIFAPSYADPLSVAIRSAPLNSNFPQGKQTQNAGGATGTSHHSQQHHQQFQQHQLQHQQHMNSNQSSSLQHGYPSQASARQPPKTANMLHPGHTLAPLLSPRAAPVILSQQQHQQQQPQHRLSHHHHPEPKTTGGAIGKQEFAIPPIVPSQQQPPHTAHPHHSSGNGNHGGYSSSSLLGRPTSSSYHGYSKSSRLEPTAPHPSNGNSNNNNNNNNNTSNTTSTSTSTLPLTAAAAPMPPQTPTTYSFAALQRQQFLQPFEHLFDTIETTRTLKSTLDDQIRRSSTLLQTLQASSTTVEGLIRSYVKEMQREMTSKMDEVLDSMVRRIGQLESKLEMEPIPATSNTVSSPSDQQQHQHHPSANANGISNNSPPPPSTITASSLKSPTAIVKSQNDIGSSEYQSMLATLRERLDRLESQLEK